MSQEQCLQKERGQNVTGSNGSLAALSKNINFLWERKANTVDKVRETKVQGHAYFP